MNPLKRTFSLINILTISFYNFVFPLHAQDELKIINHSAVIVPNDAPLLYHSSFRVLNYEFTGLVVFKNSSDEECIDVVFLSEFGLSIAEFKFSDNKAECIRCIPAVDRRPAKKYLAGIIEMALIKSENCKLHFTKKENNNLYFCKGKKGKHYYIYSSDSLKQIIYKKFNRKIIADCSKDILSEKITVQKRKKTLVEMKIVRDAFK